MEKDKTFLIYRGFDLDNLKTSTDSEIERETSDKLDFEIFFQNNHCDKVYIFPHSEKLYLIIQRKFDAIIEKSILHWNEIEGFGKLIPHEEEMIEEIIDSDLNRIIKQKLNSFFRLFEIPFYFIPLVKETYIKTRYGEMKGDWEIIEHHALKNRMTYLDFDMKQNFNMRNYQINGYREWRKNGNFGTIVLATAGGKTMIGLKAIYDLRLTTIIAVPTTPLTLQWKKALQKYLSISDEYIGLFYGKEKKLSPILIGTYNSLEKYMHFTKEDEKEILLKYEMDLERAQKIIKERKRIEKKLQNGYSLLITDESHHIPAPTFRNISLHSHALYRLSLSATVERYDHNESLLYFSSGKKIFELNFLDLCHQGWVIPFIYRVKYFKLEHHEQNYYNSLGTDFAEKKRESFFTNSKLREIRKIADKHCTKGHQILIFTSFISSVKSIYDYLTDRGILAGIVVSEKNQLKISKLNRNSTISLFHKKQIQVLISTTVLDEGYNVPDCNVAIIVSGTSSQRQLIQRIGRIVRTNGKKNKIGYVYELVSIIPSDSEFKTIYTLDHLNHLRRNNIINSIEELYDNNINGSHEMVFDYNQINRLALKRIKQNQIENIVIDYENLSKEIIFHT